MEILPCTTLGFSDFKLLAEHGIHLGDECVDSIVEHLLEEHRFSRASRDLKQQVGD